MSRLPRFSPILILALILLMLLFPAHEAAALTTCSASSTPLAFGPTAGTANTDTTAAVTITCNTTAVSLFSTVRVRMCLNIGDGADGAGQFAPRRMVNGFGDPMQFQIYRDAARSQIWGSNTIPAIPTPLLIDLQYSVVVIGGGGNANATMFARVPVQTGLASGNFNNAFSGTHTRLDYRYAEQLIGTPNYPASCTTGGIGGGNATFPFTATASVPNHCQFNIVTNLAFSNVAGSISANQDQTSTIGLTCTNRTPWQLGLNNGQNAVGNLRRMRLGTTGNYVNYELYRNAGRTLRWGNTLDTDTLTGTGSGLTQTIDVFGRVPPPQTVPAGDYKDVITVTMTF